MKRDYESMIVISASVGDESARKENEAIIKLIGDLGGELVKSDEWGKRRLAYEINKIKEGYYIVNYFKLDSNQVKNLQNKYRISDAIIRFNMLALEQGR